MVDVVQKRRAFKVIFVFCVFALGNIVVAATKWTGAAQLAQPLKIKIFGNTPVTIQASGLRIGGTLFAYDEGLGEPGGWIARSVNNKFVGYYDLSEGTWRRYDVRRNFKPSMSDQGYNIVDLGNSGPIYAMMIEDKASLDSKLKPKAFEPLYEEGLVITVLPPQLATPRPGPNHLARSRDWKSGRLEISARTIASGKIIFTSSLVGINKDTGEGPDRLAVYSYQSVANIEKNVDRGSFTVLRLDQKPVTSTRPANTALDLSVQTQYWTDGTSPPVILTPEPPDAKQKITRVPELAQKK